MIDQIQPNKTKDLVRIKVMGIGGGGNNAVNQMIKSGVDGAEYILINTEKGILDRADTSKCRTLQIGDNLTGGLGAGSNPEIGERAARESMEEIDKLLEDTDLLFITAGMGGGTGTGAIPVIAEEARKKGILTIGIVTTPFLFEGKLRKARANIGIQRLKSNVNSLIVISNDQLITSTSNNISFMDAFKMTDDVLRQGIQSITELINSVGTINIDFADVKTTLSCEGMAYMGIGESEGENKVIEATNNALNNPLTQCSIDGAKAVIFNVKGNEDVGLDDVNKSAEMIAERVNNDANIIFGTVIDESYGDKVEVTVVATGIDKKLEGED